jgi:hypothetical protein
MNREQWLMQGVDMLRPHFQAAGFPLPAKIRVSCSFPSRNVRKVEGQCWPASASADEHFEILVSPIEDDTLEVLGTLAHELAHAATPGAKHGAKFVKCARALHLEGKPKQCGAGPAFKHHLGDELVKALGKYPHGALKLAEINRTKQTTRMIKCACSQCGYTCRTTRAWLEGAGAPICPLDEIRMEVRP